MNNSRGSRMNSTFSMRSCFKDELQSREPPMVSVLTQTCISYKPPLPHTIYRCMSIFTLDTQFYFKYALLENIICWFDIKIIYLHFMVIRVYSVCVCECIAHPWHSDVVITPGVRFFFILWSRDYIQVIMHES